MKTLAPQPKSPEQIDTAVAALIMRSAFCRRTGLEEEAQRLEEITAVLVWAAGLLRPEEDPQIAALDHEINRLIAEFDRFETGLRQAQERGET